MQDNGATYQVKTEIFEGPMDLLVHLIKKNEVSIYDIPIASITRQFLAYLDLMKFLNIDFAGDFLYMASLLTNIKSRTLLPKHTPETDDAEDPRTELSNALAEYMKIKTAAQELAGRTRLNEDIFARPAPDKSSHEDSGDDMIMVGLFELIDAFQNILDKYPSASKIMMAGEEVSIKEKISEISDRLEKNGSLVFEELFSQAASKSEIVAIFLALLEMVKLCLVEIRQHTEEGVIRLFYI